MSKELEALEELKTTCDTWLRPSINNLQDDRFEMIKKELKALEIIKEKQINVNGLINHFKYGNGNYEIYLKMYRYLGLLLTQDEFDLLKEVLL